MVIKGRSRVAKTILALAILLPSFFCFGQAGAQLEKPENSIGKTDRSLTGLVAEMEVSDMNEGLRQWTDPKMIEELASVKLTDAYMRDLYKEFMGTIVSPPPPDDTREYGIEHGEESLKKVITLGRRIHNLGQALSDEDYEKYGDLLKAMRDVLYLDSKHIPLAIKHDNSRDVYWFTLHNKWLEAVQDRYQKLFHI